MANDNVFRIYKNFPPSLSADEERDLIIKLKYGYIETKNKLIEHNLRLVGYVVKGFLNSGYSYDDLISVGTIGLIKSVNTFDPDKYLRFATYAVVVIRNEILMYIRSEKKHLNDVSFDAPFATDKEDNALLLSDVLPVRKDPYDKIFFDEQKASVIEFLNTCGANERKAFLMYYGLGLSRSYTQKEIANHLCLSQSYVSRIIKNIQFRLKKKYA